MIEFIFCLQQKTVSVLIAGITSPIEFGSKHEEINQRTTLPNFYISLSKLFRSKEPSMLPPPPTEPLVHLVKGGTTQK